MLRIKDQIEVVYDFDARRQNRAADASPIINVANCTFMRLSRAAHRYSPLKEVGFIAKCGA